MRRTIRDLRKRWRKRRAARKPPPAGWARLPDDIQAALESMYRGEPQEGTDGTRHETDGKTDIGKEKGTFLFELHERVKPDVSLEIGLAYGFSTLYFLAAMRASAHGRHIAVDPFQERWFHGIGHQHVKRLGFGDRFRLIEAPAALALPRLAEEGTRVQLVYVDGDHKFDSVMLDFTLSALLLDEGGVVVFDDLWMPGVRKAVSFVRKNRDDFREVPSPIRNYGVFERIGKDERHWTHHVRF